MGNRKRVAGTGMPRLIYSRNALYDLQRLHRFLSAKNPAAAKRARESILKSVQTLRLQPNIGRPVEDMPDEYREWVVDFGDSGYIIYYRVSESEATILAVRHQKEAP